MLLIIFSGDVCLLINVIFCMVLFLVLGLCIWVIVVGDLVIGMFVVLWGKLFLGVLKNL